MWYVLTYSEVLGLQNIMERLDNSIISIERSDDTMNIFWPLSFALVALPEFGKLYISSSFVIC